MADENTKSLNSSAKGRAIGPYRRKSIDLYDQDGQIIKASNNRAKGPFKLKSITI